MRRLQRSEQLESRPIPVIRKEAIQTFYRKMRFKRASI